ncbi:MAG TPA: PAS domain S-box protein, partial [Spirochaetota bacterium]
ITIYIKTPDTFIESEIHLLSELAEDLSYGITVLRTRAAHAESENRYRALVETAPDAIIVHRNGCILYANSKALHLYGAENFEQLAAYNILDLVPESDQSRARERMKHLMDDKSIPLREMSIIRITGGKIAVEAVGSSIEYQGEKAVQTIIRDITERKNSDAALRQSEKRYKSLFNTMTEGFALHEIIFDDKGEPSDYRFLEINPAFEKITGLKKEEIIGKFHNDVLPGDNPEFVKKYGNVARTGNSIHFDNYSPAIGRHFDVFSYRLDDNKCAVIFTDITERKQIEDDLYNANSLLKERNAELDAFAYSVSHDLRSPLHTIISSGKILVENIENFGAREMIEHLSRIIKASDKMSHLIEDMLKLFRISRAEINYTDVNLSALARTVVDDLKLASPERKIEIVITDDIIVHADSSLMRIVIENLMSNAWKFTSPCVYARIEFFVMTENDETCYVIRDNGVGFNKEYVDRLFNPFQRLHTESEFPGAGIGLTIVKKIIERHRGKVWAEGEINEGAAIFFKIPAKTFNK